MRRGNAIAVTLVGLTALAHASQAAATGVFVESVWQRGVVRDSVLRVRAGAGETNRLVVTDEGSRRLRVRDDGAGVTGSPPCESVSDHEVVCAAGSVEVLGGDGDDEIRVPFGWAEGGPGSDLLVGAEQSDQLQGDEGADRLRGMGGNDVLYQSPALDGQPDVIEGGAGHDVVGYRVSGGVVSVDLEAGLGPEGDRISDAEDAQVAYADAPRLSGDSGVNQLRTIGGRGLLDGRGGADFLHAESYLRDRLIGGDGNDALQLATPTTSVSETDVLDCGDGTDVVWLPSPRQLIPVTCERVGFDEGDKPRYRLHLPLARRGAAFATVAAGKCPTLRREPCRFEWVVRAGRRRIAGRTQVVSAGRRGREVPLRLSRQGRRLLASRGHVRVAIGIQEPRRVRYGFRFDLQAP